MAEIVTGGELVPRGVEGTGSATILDNQQTMQSLARLAGRLDNYERLKAVTAAKKAAAAKTVKQEYDKTPLNFDAPEGGIVGDFTRKTNEGIYQELLKQWKVSNPEDKIVLGSTAQRAAQSLNSWAKDADVKTPVITKTYNELGWNTEPEKLNQYRADYFKQVDDATADAVTKNNIKNPLDILDIRTKIATGNNANGQDFVGYISQRIKEDPENVNFNKFGKRLYEEFGKSGREIIEEDGKFSKIDNNRIWRKNPQTQKLELDKNLIMTAISANKNDQEMFTTGMTPLIQDAANQFGKEAIDALNVYTSGAKLNDAQKKIIQTKVLPRAQNAALQKMFAYRGDFDVVDNFQTTKQKSQAEEQGIKQASTTSYTGPVVQDLSYNSVKPSAGGETEVKGLNNKPLKINRGKVTLGNGITKTLGKDDKFEFNTGTRMYFIGAIPESVKRKLGSRNEDGSYSTEMPFETQNLTLIKDEVYATNKNSKFKLKNGSEGFRPKGHVMPVGTPGAVAIGKNLAIVELNDYLKTMPEEVRKIIQFDKEGDELKGIKVLLTTDDNQQVLSKFRGELEPVKVPKKNSSVSVVKRRK